MITAERVDVNELTSSSWGPGTPWALQKEVETPQQGLGWSMGDALHHGGDSGTCCLLPPPNQPRSAFGLPERCLIVPAPKA